MAKHYITYPRVEGTSSRQAHADLPDGTFERELGKEGFFGPATHMYHAHPPTGWVDFQGPLKPRAFDLNALEEADCPWKAAAVLSNAACKFRYWKTSKPMSHLVRNADGDELLFIHEGAGHFYCDYGHLEFRDGDYILLPRSTMWRIEPTQPVEMLLIEATNDTYLLPDRGLVGPHAFFDPAMMDVPRIDDAFKAQQRETQTDVRIKRLNEISVATYPFNPLDAVGWKGDLTVSRINWRDFRPLVSHRYHLPPSAHTTFLTSRFVVCTFVPRPFETDPGALKVPFFHNNDDFDEVIFYHRGDFFSRDNIDKGMVTFHPCGFTHGPHPKALSRAFVQTKEATDEVAVMIDTRDPLNVDALPASVENPDYFRSWMPPVAKAAE